MAFSSAALKFHEAYGLWPSIAEKERLQIEHMKANLELEIYHHYTMSRLPARKPPTTQSGKCPCCGSRQYVMHNQVKICAYCRSEA